MCDQVTARGHVSLMTVHWGHCVFCHACALCPRAARRIRRVALFCKPWGAGCSTAIRSSPPTPSPVPFLRAQQQSSPRAGDARCGLHARPHRLRPAATSQFAQCSCLHHTGFMDSRNRPSEDQESTWERGREGGTERRREGRREGGREGRREGGRRSNREREK
jgi:hypothetical protein